MIIGSMSIYEQISKQIKTKTNQFSNGNEHCEVKMTTTKKKRKKPKKKK